MKINVTAEDIKNGARVHCCICPVSLAIRRALNQPINLENYFNVQTGFMLISIVGEEVKRYNTPKSVQRFINKFDMGKEVKPFSFFLK